MTWTAHRMPATSAFQGRAVHRAVAFLGCLCACFVACSATPRAAAQETADPGVAPASFAGRWESTFGALILKQDGTRVTGEYSLGAACTLEGTVSGRRLDFTYREPQAHGSGTFELAADGCSFSGTWRPDGATRSSEWTGKRVGPTFAGLWETSFGRMRLSVDGTGVRGHYSFNGLAEISGTLESGAGGSGASTFRFEYSQPDGEKGAGRFELAADGETFGGTWKSESGPGGRDGGGGGRWLGKRVQPAPGRIWLIVLEANWESGLGDTEYSYGEMLRTFFRRAPQVQVRHRFVHDLADLRRFCAEASFLAEPVVLYISSHGTSDGVGIGPTPVGAAELTDCLAAADLRLLHFGACAVMSGTLPRTLLAGRAPPQRFPISGFTESVDWAGSAIVDFTYMELVLVRGMAPTVAVARTKEMLQFARSPGDAGRRWLDRLFGSRETIPATGLAIFDPTAEFK